MQNKALANDYITRCSSRLKALEVLFKEESWPDVVRESQEVVELALKALLRKFNIDFPRVHDVSEIIKAEIDQLPAELKKNIPQMIKISKSLRRDRELAFYGSEDLTPLEFYSKDDAKEAKTNAEWLVKTLIGFIKDP